MDFRNVKSITIPEGSVKKIIKDGVVLWQKAQPTTGGYIKFYSDEEFIIYKSNGNDGQIEWSYDAVTWTVWISATSPSKTKTLYLRGTGNTRICGDYGGWTMNTTIGTRKVYCEGNIENLLDYQTVALGNHPSMTRSCFERMFRGCIYLYSAPELPAITLAEKCYEEMFDSCTNLITPPSVLPATTLLEDCYRSMFYGCTKLTTAPVISATTMGESSCRYMFQGCNVLKVSEDSGTTKFFDCPNDTSASYCVTDMFKQTGGTYTGNPQSGHSYYYN